MIKNWKTSLFGIMAFVMVNGETLGLPTKYQKILEGVSIAALGFSSKDKNITGVGVEAKSASQLGIKE